MTKTMFDSEAQQDGRQEPHGHLQHSSAAQTGDNQRQPAIILVTHALTAAQQAIKAAQALLAEMQASRDSGATLEGDDWIDARSSGLSVRTFRRAARNGEFPAYRIGRRLLASRRDVAAYIAKQRIAPARQEKTGVDPFERGLLNGALARKVVNS